MVDILFWSLAESIILGAVLVLRDTGAPVSLTWGMFGVINLSALFIWLG